MRTSDPVFDLLTQFCGQRGQITIPRALVSLTGDIKTALVLSQIVYWSSMKSQEDGWFYKTYADWSEELALSRHEVSRVMDGLNQEGLVEMEVRKQAGTPKLHYRFSISAFRKWMCEKGEVDVRKTGDQMCEKGEVLPYCIQKNTTEEYSQKNTEADAFSETGTGTGNRKPETPSPSSPTLDQPGSTRENPETEPETEAPEPFNPDALGKTLCSKFKRLRGVRSFPAASKSVVAYKLQHLDPSWSEVQVLAVFDLWSAESYWREFDTAHKVRSFFEFLGKQDDRPQVSSTVRHWLDLTVAAPPEAPGMSSTPTPSVKPMERIFDDWNLAVPERPADRSLFSRRPEAFSEAFLFERFPEICEKAKLLIQAGADLTFGFLMAFDKSTGQYRWQQLLAGQLEWMKAKKPAANGKPDGASNLARTNALIAKMKMKEESDARAKRTDPKA